MSELLSHLNVHAVSTRTALLIFVLFAVNFVFNVCANASFKLSAASPNWRGLLAWQVAGNLAGLITVITLTWILRYIPLRTAFPITAGLTVIGVQVLAARLFFHEPITFAQWVGSFLIVLGIVLIGGR